MNPDMATRSTANRLPDGRRWERVRLKEACEPPDDRRTQRKILASHESELPMPPGASRMGFAAAPKSPWPPPTALGTPANTCRSRNLLKIRRK